MSSLEKRIAKKFPQLSFMRSCHKREAEIPIVEKITHACLLQLNQKLEGQECQLLILLGAQKGDVFEILKLFLENNTQAHVVLLEEDLELLFAFMNEESLFLWEQHPRFHIKYALKSFKEALEEIVIEFPLERIQIHLNDHYRVKENEEELLLFLRRRATLSSSLHHEIVYYHLLVENLLSNFKQFPSCFYADALRGGFKNIPAIICGAGPSLDEQIEGIKQLSNKALILAGGSTLAALEAHGIPPHLGFALDPNPEEILRLKKIKNCLFPLLFGGRLHQGILEGYLGPKGYLKTGSGGPFEQAFEAHLGLELEPLLKDVGEEGLSVTVLCLSAAYHLGCNPIILSGVDLAFVLEKRYATGVLPNNQIEAPSSFSCADERVWVKNRNGEAVLTCVKWLMEQKVIEEFAAKHPDVTFYECRGKGLGFPSLKVITLQQLKDILAGEQDLEKSVKTQITSCPSFAFCEDLISEWMKTIDVSLKNIKLLLKKMELRISVCDLEQKSLSEDPLITLYQMDMEEEVAYELFFKSLHEHQFHQKSLSEQISHYALLAEQYINSFALFFGHEKIETLR